MNSDFKFINHNLQLEVFKHQIGTNSENYIASSLNVKCKNSDNLVINIQKFKHCIINSLNSLYKDAFLSLDLLNAKSLNEVQQYKHTK